MVIYMEVEGIDGINSWVALETRYPDFNLNHVIALARANIVPHNVSQQTLQDPEFMSRMCCRLGPAHHLFATACMCSGLFTWVAQQSDFRDYLLDTNREGYLVSGTANCFQFIFNVYILSGLVTKAEAREMYASACNIQKKGNLINRLLATNRAFADQLGLSKDNVKPSSRSQDVKVVGWEYFGSVEHYAFVYKDVAVHINAPIGSKSRIEEVNNIFASELAKASEASALPVIWREGLPAKLQWLQPLWVLAKQHEAKAS